jgi:hypothetical protein
MALLEVARFMRLEEAQVAASALRGSGMPVVVLDEVLGYVNCNLIYAIGGVRVMASPEDASAARSFLDSCRTRPSELVPLPAGEAGWRAALSLVVSLLFGLVVPFRSGRRRWRRG